MPAPTEYISKKNKKKEAYQLNRARAKEKRSPTWSGFDKRMDEGGGKRADGFAYPDNEAVILLGFLEVYDPIQLVPFPGLDHIIALKLDLLGHLLGDF